MEIKGLWGYTRKDSLYVTTMSFIVSQFCSLANYNCTNVLSITTVCYFLGLLTANFLECVCLQFLRKERADNVNFSNSQAVFLVHVNVDTVKSVLIVEIFKSHLPNIAFLFSQSAMREIFAVIQKCCNWEGALQYEDNMLFHDYYYYGCWWINIPYQLSENYIFSIFIFTFNC